MPAASQARRSQEGQPEHPVVRGESRESGSSSPMGLRQVRPLDHRSAPEKLDLTQSRESREGFKEEVSQELPVPRCL